MGRIIGKNWECDHVDCASSDANQIYEDFSSFCFSCKKPRPENYWNENHSHFKKEWKQRKPMTDEEIEEIIDTSDTGFSVVGNSPNSFNRLKPLTEEEIVRQRIKTETEVKEIYEEYGTHGWKDRRVYKAVAEHYGVKATVTVDGEPDAYYFPEKVNDQGVPESYSCRTLPKVFRSIGDVTKEVFGLHLYSSGKRVIITEGHVDAMAIQSASFKKYGRFYPIVSLGSSSCLDNLVANRTKLRMFDEIIFWPDNDSEGQGAAIIPEVAKILGYDKVKIVDCKSYGDASDVWSANKEPDILYRFIWNASPYTPASVMTGAKLWDALVEYNKIESVPYPEFMSGINAKTKGMRFGDITLFISGTGSGKSSLVREIAWHILQTTGDKLGINALEEGPAETARKMAGLALSKNPAKDEIPLEELKVGFDMVFGGDKVLVLDHQGSISDGTIMDHLEFMCLSGCKYIIIDHITILASEGAGGLTGNEAVDKIMNDLLKVAKKHNVWIGLISHLRKTGGEGKSFEEGKLPSMDDIKGSGSIKQISMDIIAFSRDMGNDDEVVRNTILTKVLKCRYTGLTGPSGNIKYTYDTGRLSVAEDASTSVNNSEGFMKV